MPLIAQSSAGKFPPPARARISVFDEALWPVDEAFARERTKLVNERFSVSSSLEEESSFELGWGELQDRPEEIFAEQQKRFTVTPDGYVSEQLDLDGYFVRRDPSKLLVMFHGALDRDKYHLPRFEYQRALKDFDGSILFVQDPTLYVHPRLTLGWYIGTQLDDGHAMVARLINEAVNVLNTSHLVIAGSSGGGFASLAVSARIPGSSALVFSPQTSIENYTTGHRRRFISAAFPDLQPNFENLSSIENRIDMGALYSKGSQNRVFYLQNTGDPYHMKKHCLPFLEHAGLNFLDGEMRNERIRMECRYLSQGHNAPRANQLQLYVNRVFSGGF